MIAEDLFGYLPANELVEQNQVFRNIDGAMFESMPDWGLGATESGRGMSMADLDNDGDLDIIINNLMTESVIFENQLCGGSNLTVSLRQPDTSNLDAVGTRLRLHTSAGVYQREVRIISGYLSGDSPQVHFGFPNSTQIEYLEIIWNDGEVTRLDNLEIDTQLIVTRSE